MANVHRFRHADPKRVRSYAVDSATVIEVGDLCYLEVDDIRPASDFTYVTGNLGRTQANFIKQFQGVAMTASASGETSPVQVATRGTFELDCAAAQFEHGDWLGPDDNAGGTALVDQQVIAVGENGYGCLRAGRRYSANTTSVVCEILPWSSMMAAVPMYVSLGTSLITAAADVVTNFTAEWPFKLVRVITIVKVALTGSSVLTIRNGATALDDTHTITSGAAVGVVDATAMDDATGDDIFVAGDQLDVASDGGATAGEVEVILEIKPFLLEQ